MAVITQRGRRLTQARNSHLPAMARRTLDVVTPIIQQQAMNAFSVSGYPVFIYNRMEGGTVCTCSFAHSLNNPTPLYNPEGKATVKVLNSISDQAHYNISEYNPSPTFEDSLGEAPSYFDPVSIPNNEPDTDEVFIDPDAELTSVDAYSNGACNVCQGTGYKGGYNFQQGVRWVFDATDIVASSGVETDTGTGPYTMTFVKPDAWVEFKVRLPLVNPRCRPIVQLWNNHDRVQPAAGPGPSVTVVPANTNAPSYNIQQGIQSVGICVLRVSAANFIESRKGRGVEFTHLEIQVPLSLTPLIVDMPNLVRSKDPQRTSIYSSATFALPPNVPLLKPLDLISDMTHKLHWLVTASHPVSPASGRMWAQEVDVRPVEPYEAMSSMLLPQSGWLPYSGNPLTPYRK